MPRQEGQEGQDEPGDRHPELHQRLHPAGRRRHPGHRAHAAGTLLLQVRPPLPEEVRQDGMLRPRQSSKHSQRPFSCVRQG